MSSTQASVRRCPATGRTHEWQEPEQCASRSPCPALNTMANHDYLPRDGRNITVFKLITALQECYNLTAPLAWFIAIGGFLLLRNFTFHAIDLYDIGRHNHVEHDASLVHADTAPGDLYAPTDVIPELVDALIADAHTTDGSSKLMSAKDVGRARVRVEATSPKLDAVHAEIARGEMAIMLGMWAQNDIGAPVEWVRDWLTHERMPAAWNKQQRQGLLATVRKSKEIRAAMDSIRGSSSSGGVGSAIHRAASTGVRALNLESLSHRTKGTLTPSASISSNGSSTANDSIFVMTDSDDDDDKEF